MKILVAIPAYDRKLHVETARSLLNEQAAALSMGDELSTVFAPGCSLITYARNHLVREFLTSDAERLVFVDSDISWELGALLRIAHHPVDFVGGAYRFKDENEGYPLTWLPKSDLWSNELGLLEVGGLAGGFLALSRKVFELHRNHFPDQLYEHDGQIFWGYFQAPFRHKRLMGEDGCFSMECREAGLKIWLDPDITLSHWDGGREYKGRIGDWLLRKSCPMPENSILKASQIDGWMSHLELQWLAEQASKHQSIAEVGSYLGRSTRALADNTQGKVWAIDDWLGPRDTFIPEHEREGLYERFRGNMNGLLESGKVQPVRSDHRSLAFNEPVDMVFIDGSHDYEDVKRDIAFWQSRLKPNGLLCGHDFPMEGVKRAVEELVPRFEVAPNTTIWFARGGIE